MSILKRVVNKFRYAYNGFIHGLKYDLSVRLQCCIAVAAIAVSLLLGFTAEEMTIVMLYCALIIGLEFINSSIERIMNLEEPEINKSVKHIKDMAAAGVLTASVFALITGLMFVIRHLTGG